MRIEKRPFGPYETNCYVLFFDDFEIIIDPGMGAAAWVQSIVQNPRAILLTHGHFDHIFDAPKLAEILKIPVFCPENDVFMLESDCFGTGITPFQDATKIPTDAGFHTISFGSEYFTFHHFPGHTPGSCMIETNETFFSGDFIFAGTIGRYDFPYSDATAMKNSLQKFLNLVRCDMMMFPGHGAHTTLFAEKHNVQKILRKF